MKQVLKVTHNVKEIPNPLVCADLDEVITTLEEILGDDDEWYDNPALKIAISVEEMDEREYNQLIEDEWYG